MADSIRRRQSVADRYPAAFGALRRIFAAEHPERQADASAIEVLVALERAWRLADRAFRYTGRQRGTPCGVVVAANLKDLDRRRKAVFGVFDKYCRRDGAAAAAAKAAEEWTRPLAAADTYGDKNSPRVAARAFRPDLWEIEITTTLIEALERELGRPLVFKGRGPTSHGDDLAVLVDAFAVAARQRLGLAPSEPVPVDAFQRGKGVRKPGRAQWFANRIRARCRAAADQLTEASLLPTDDR